jgi:hypothetical protein
MQQEDGPEPKNDNGSTFKFSRIVPMTLFGKNAPPPSKAIMQIKPGSAKLAFKRKQVSNVAAPPSPGEGEEDDCQEDSKGGRTIFCGMRSSEHQPGLHGSFRLIPLNRYILTQLLFLACRLMSWISPVEKSQHAKKSPL